MKKNLLIICFVLAILPASSQEKLSLNDCIIIGFKNNLTLKNKSLDIAKAKLVNKQSVWNNLPRINFGASQDYEYGFNIEPTTNTRTNEDFLSNDLALNASVDVFNLAKLKRQSKTKIDLLKSVVDLDADRKILLINIVQYYLEVMFNKEYVSILENQLLESENQLDRLNKALSFGYISKSELYDAEAEYAIDKKNVLIGKNSTRRSILNLFNLLNYKANIDEVEFVDVKFELDTTPIGDKRKLIAKTLNNNNQITSAKYNLESAKKQVEIYRAQYFPTIKLQYQLESFFTKSLSNPDDDYDSFNSQLRNNQTNFIGASISVPIFNGLQNRYDVQIAKVEYEKAKIDQEIVTNNINYQVQQTLQDLENAISTYETSLQVVHAALESFRMSRLKYEQGKINAFNFAAAKENSLKAEIELLDSKYKIYFFREKLKIFSIK